MSNYENPWLYYGAQVDEDIIDDYVGFVYEITNLSNQRMYIGKKLFKFSRTKTVKGKKKKVKIDSDWKTYYGSNKELQEDVEALGANNFKRTIIKLCKSKGDCNYTEAKLQFERGVLESDTYYNTWISVKVHKKHFKK